MGTNGEAAQNKTLQSIYLIIKLLVQFGQLSLTLLSLGVGQTHPGDVGSGRYLVVIYGVIQCQDLSVGLLFIILLVNRHSLA